EFVTAQEHHTAPLSAAFARVPLPRRVGSAHSRPTAARLARRRPFAALLLVTSGALSSSCFAPTMSTGVSIDGHAVFRYSRHRHSILPALRPARGWPG